ncbi:MAG: RluA family pseudouridine synthase [Planctomycetes bacterium]|nr:RluA family pseudouridine synthase [Planctomycetota bacterium]
MHKSGTKEVFDLSDLLAEERRRSFVVSPEEEGLRLDVFLGKKLPWMSRTRLQQLKVEWAGYSKGRPEKGRIKKSMRLAEGDGIEVVLPRDPKDLEEARRDPPLKHLDVLFEDESILVINKPAGIPVHPVGMNLHRTVLTALHHRYRNPESTEQVVSPCLVHRLDLETSGVLLLAKDVSSLRNLAAQFRGRSVTKRYLAVVYGLMESSSGRIDLPIGSDETSRVPYKRRVDPEEGQRAVTHYQVLDRGQGLTKVLLEPHTGRKHQLRVHLAALGHPIVGDKIYGPDEKYYFMAREAPPGPEELKALLLSRQALHAFQLGFTHPKTGEDRLFEAPLPESFENLLRASRPVRLEEDIAEEEVSCRPSLPGRPAGQAKSLLNPHRSGTIDTI